ncbi:unnamed protein product [Didymodactylos carnosus]|uniref:Uncharacterized protein n=1 Tax=Didymodactylos carnosus TaxID=1234261 RepID=A0A813X9Y1_9BILA|nr:unnamed protein product [Didymodactylos carnosus]CAF0869971.1 unnamed protein product [Didymodactylos carnosus]CAF3546378.1 unnamed protein product [Didymodactylos carnosus]CAF3657315.1 unnamed protein product [Didymodactylos carnosus]
MKHEKKVEETKLTDAIADVQIASTSYLNSNKIISVNSATTITTTIKGVVMPPKSISTLIERGSFTSSFNDDIFTSHDFELDVTIKILQD